MKRYATLALLLLCITARAQNDKIDYRLGKSMEILLNVFRESNLYYVDSVNSDKMLRDGARAMLSGLDPYTEYMPSNEMEEFETLTTGKYAGVGALIAQKGDWTEIAEPYRNTPADRAGLRAGDRIMAIDGENLRGATSERVSKMLRGEPGTTFRLTYRPLADTTTMREVEIKRERIFQPSVSFSGYIAPGIGLIRLDTFIEDGSIEVREAMAALKKQGKLDGLIIDLRTNTGGVVSEAVKIASFFLPKGTEVVSLKGKIKEFDSKYTTKTAPTDPDLPLVILQSSISASASEILSGTLQDLDRAVIIGQRSYGKGLVQSTRQVGYDSYLKVTTAKYYIPSGRSIQALDYTHRKEDGSVGHIPDSLVKEFRTAAGRKVYNGGGVQPDIIVEREYLAKFTSILLAYNFIDDFANLYAAYNTPVAINEFKVNDTIYAQFTDYMRDKTIVYESGTAQSLKDLREWAEREKYDDRLIEEFAAIERKIKEDKMVELRTFSDEIRDVLAQTIISRWHYQSGGIEYMLKQDLSESLLAAKMLQNKAEYQKILSEQDTERK